MGAPARPAASSRVTCVQSHLCFGHHCVSDSGPGSVTCTVCKPLVNCQLAPEVRGTQSLGKLLARRSGSSEQELAEACGQEGLLSLTDIWPLHFRGLSSAAAHPSLQGLHGLPGKGRTPFSGQPVPPCVGGLPCCPVTAAAPSATPGCGPLEPRHRVCPPGPRVRQGFPRGAAWKLRIEI